MPSSGTRDLLRSFSVVGSLTRRRGGSESRPQRTSYRCLLVGDGGVNVDLNRVAVPPDEARATARILRTDCDAQSVYPAATVAVVRGRLERARRQREHDLVFAVPARIQFDRLLRELKVRCWPAGVDVNVHTQSPAQVPTDVVVENDVDDHEVGLVPGDLVDRIRIRDVVRGTRFGNPVVDLHIPRDPSTEDLDRTRL